MLDDRQRAKLSHPARGILRRAAATGALPDRAELDELGLPDELTAQVAEAAQIVADLGGAGVRNRSRARQLAEQLADSVAEATPRGRRGSLPPPDTLPDAGDLAEAVLRRMAEYESSTTDIDDLDAERQALREARRARQAAV